MGKLTYIAAVNSLSPLRFPEPQQTLFFTVAFLDSELIMLDKWDLSSSLKWRDHG